MATANAAASTVAPPKSVSSEQWNRVARDPVVQRFKEAVDGTLFDVRPIEPAAVDESKEHASDEPADGVDPDA